jgi:hypothetical protein
LAEFRRVPRRKGIGAFWNFPLTNRFCHLHCSEHFGFEMWHKVLGCVFLGLLKKLRVRNFYRIWFAFLMQNRKSGYFKIMPLLRVLLEMILSFTHRTKRPRMQCHRVVRSFILYVLFPYLCFHTFSLTRLLIHHFSSSFFFLFNPYCSGYNYV